MNREENTKKTWMSQVDFKDSSSLVKQGFSEFSTVRELVDEGQMVKIPPKNGVYLILFPENKQVGFNGGDKKTFALNKTQPKNPDTLRDKQWVKGTRVIYIGKAGVLNGKGASNLRKRLREYMKWYQKKSNKHHGGRDIWQINHPGDLLVTWRVTEGVDPESCEKALLDKFTAEFKTYPFANHRR